MYEAWEVLQREIKEIKKWRDVSCSQVRRQDIVKSPFCLNQAIDSIPFQPKFQQAFLKNLQTKSKSYMSIKYPKYVKKIIGRNFITWFQALS